MLRASGSRRHVIERRQQMRPEFGIVLDHGEMPHALHYSEARPGNG